jgi:uncharacterized protein (TIGR01777 family)
MRVFVAGGTGLVGGRLVKRLLERGDQPVVLTRRPETAQQKWGAACTVIAGDPVAPGAWMDSIKDCNAAVNLVGEGIFYRRWSAAFKQILHDSRVKSTANIVAALVKNPALKTLVNASAIGYYGSTGDEELTEASPPGTDFLAQLCVDWEGAALAAAAQGVRTVILRVGVVLDPAGGALQKMITPFKMFVGGPIGSGKQYVSWIHHEDLAGLILFALDNAQAAGPMNATAPGAVTNKMFSKALGRALHRPSFMPTPGFMLRVALGPVAGIITKGQRVLPKKALDLGYAFKFADIDKALQEMLAAPKDS